MGRLRLLRAIGVLVVVSLLLPACAPASRPGAAPGSGAGTPVGEVAGSQGTPGTAPGAASGPVSGTVRVMGVWGGEELAAFREVIAAWERQTGGRVEFEATRDISTVLRARVQGNNSPDIALLPNPALMQALAREGRLRPLDQLLDAPSFRNDFSQAWSDLGTVNGNLYGLFVKAVPKNTVWYSPRRFGQQGYQIPATWDDLIRLSDQIAVTGTAPWAVGLESQAASGWPGSDWIQELYLREFGPDLYDRWVSHDLPWTDPSVRAAFQRFGRIAANDGYVAGGIQNVLASNFQDASFLPFVDPPRAYLHFVGAFAQTFLVQQFPDLRPGQDYDFFPFPTLDQRYEGALTGAADVAVMFNETEASRSFLRYMATAQAWEPWARRGGFTSPNRSFDEAAYPDEVARKVARQLTEARIFRFDADDLMPPQVQQAEWSALLEFVRNPGRLDSLLQGVENVARDAYGR